MMMQQTDTELIQQNGSAPTEDTGNENAFDANVQISFKKVTPLQIEIDIDQLTVADIEFVEKLSGGKASIVEIVEFLGKVIPGTDINTIPIRAIRMIGDAVISAIGGASDPNA